MLFDKPDILTRIDGAIERITSGNASMRVPAESMDPDVVLADCREMLKAQAAETPYPMRFPTMLRKMWSGGDVQRWLDELPPLFVRSGPTVPAPDRPKMQVHKKRYVVYPGEVRSKADGQVHFVCAADLIRLYEVDHRECIVHRQRQVYDRGYIEPTYPGMIPLTPRGDGKYADHLSNLKAAAESAESGLMMKP